MFLIEIYFMSIKSNTTNVFMRKFQSDFRSLCESIEKMFEHDQLQQFKVFRKNEKNLKYRPLDNTTQKKIQ